MSPPPPAATSPVTPATGPRGRPRQAALDGYRGLFVMLVVLYHVGVERLAGGWIGINHFFVFSGFLITRLLVQEVDTTGRVRVVDFYRRRARRLLPALLALVTVVLAHTALLATAEQRGQVGGDAAAALGFVLNWRLIARDDAYFDLVGSPSPLRHVWTLAVEEQFYLLVPLLVLGLCRTTRRRAVRAAVPLALAVASAAWTAHLASGQAGHARLYYGTDTRAQALLVGTATAFLLARGRTGPPPLPPRGLVEAAAWTGMATSLAALGVLAETTTWVFTSGGMLLFALAAALVGLAAVDPRPISLNRVFSLPPLVALGRMSYGIYLYHWPVRLWLPLTGLPRWLAGTIQVALVLALAAASFRLLEVPVLRHGLRALPLGRGRPLVAAGGLLALVAASLVLAATPTPAPPRDVPALVAGQPPYRPGPRPVPAVVIGDSVASSLAAGLDPRAHPDLRVENQTQIGCDLMTAPVLRDGRPVTEDPACAAWRQRWLQVVRERHAQVVVLVAGTHVLTTHAGPGGPARPGSAALAGLLTADLDRMREQARAAGARRMLLVNLPCRRIDPARLDPRLRFFAAEGSDDAAVDWANRTLAAWARSRPDVELADLHGALCGQGFRERLHGVVLYHDTLHLSPRAAAMVWTWLAPRVRDAGAAAGPVPSARTAP